MGILYILLAQQNIEVSVPNEKYQEEIIYDINQATYPKEPYVSFLDHILVSKNLITNQVSTLPIDDWMNGYDIYEAYISDHKPVFLSFKIE